MKNFSLITIFLLSVLCIKAQSPVRDSLFADNSLLAASTSSSGGGGHLILQPDGKILLGGYHYTPGFGAAFIDISRFDHCGNFDSTFGVNGVASIHFDNINTLLAMKLQSDGKILCAGIQAPSTAGSQQMAYIARVNADGSPDSTFNNTGSFSQSFDGISSGEFLNIDILPDGRILATGNCRANINGGQYAYAAMRFMPDGSLDTTFNGNGLFLLQSVVFPTGNIHGYLLPNGKTILATALIGNQQTLQVIQIDSSGFLDTSFGTNGVYNDPTLFDFSTGRFTVLDHNLNLLAIMAYSGGSFYITRITPAGVIDNAFGVNGSVSFSASLAFSAKHLSILQNGQIAVLGNSSFSLGDGILLLNSDGSIDSTFATNGILYTSTPAFNLGITSMLELPNNKLMLGFATSTTNAMKFTPQSNVPHISQNVGSLSSTGAGTFQWYLNNVAINGATQSTYTFNQNGSYAVLITDIDGCSYMSDPFVVTNTGLLQLKANSVNIFPNPAHDKISIMSPANATIKIMDVTGRLVMMDDVLANDRKEVNITGLKKGVYSIEVVSDSTSRVRFIKQ